MHTYIHTCIHTYTHIHTHTYIHTYIYIYIYTQHTYIHIHTFINSCIHTYTHIYILIHTYTHTYIHACMHACIHTYIQWNQVILTSFYAHLICTVRHFVMPFNSSLLTVTFYSSFITTLSYNDVIYFIPIMFMTLQPSSVIFIETATGVIPALTNAVCYQDLL
jgi:hypothetical protein